MVSCTQVRSFMDLRNQFPTRISVPNKSCLCRRTTLGSHYFGPPEEPQLVMQRLKVRLIRVQLQSCSWRHSEDRGTFDPLILLFVVNRPDILTPSCSWRVSFPRRLWEEEPVWKDASPEFLSWIQGFYLALMQNQAVQVHLPPLKGNDETNCTKR